mgnify:CR=1 FL=1
METKRQQVYAIIAGVCFILLGICKGLYLGRFGSLLTAICSITSGILWLVRKKKLPFFLFACMYCVTQTVDYLSILVVNYDAFFGVSFIWSFHWYTVRCVVGMIAFLAFLFVVIITYIPAAMDKPKSRVKNIVYFVPGFLMVLVLIIDPSGFDWDYLISYGFHENILPILALFTSCLWLKDCHTPIFQKKAPAPAAPLIGRAERLQQYKDLLDAGVLTQAEFDAKKAEILHL